MPTYSLVTQAPRASSYRLRSGGAYGPRDNTQFDQSAVAPHAFLTGAEWSWGVVYQQYAEMLNEGRSVINRTIPRRMSGTLKDHFCKLSPFGPAVTSSMRDRILSAQKELVDGSKAIYQGPLRDNRGNIVIAAGKTISIQDPALDGINWLLEGIQGDIRSRDNQHPRSLPQTARIHRHTCLRLSDFNDALRRVLCPLGCSFWAVFASIYRAGFGSWYSWQNSLVRAAPLHALWSMHSHSGSRWPDHGGE